MLFRNIIILCILTVSCSYIATAKGENNIALGFNILGYEIGSQAMISLDNNVGIGIGGKKSWSIPYSNENVFFSLRLVNDIKAKYAVALIYEWGVTQESTIIQFGGSYLAKYYGFGVGLSLLWEEYLIKINYLPINIYEDNIHLALICGNTGIEVVDTKTGCIVGYVGPKNNYIYFGFSIDFEKIFIKR